MRIYYTHSYSGRSGESRELLASVLGSENVARIRTEGEFGKPVIDGQPPFSVSHSGDMWAVLISEEDDVISCGLDIQYDRKADYEKIARRFFAEKDAELMRRASDDSISAVRDTFFRLWSGREALIKAAGGSVADRECPAVSGGSAVYDGGLYLICDIQMPVSGSSHGVQSGGCSGYLYAAAAIRCGRETYDRGVMPGIQFINLGSTD